MPFLFPTPLLSPIYPNTQTKSAEKLLINLEWSNGFQALSVRSRGPMHGQAPNSCFPHPCWKWKGEACFIARERFGNTRGGKKTDSIKMAPLMRPLSEAFRLYQPLKAPDLHDSVIMGCSQAVVITATLVEQIFFFFYFFFSIFSLSFLPFFFSLTFNLSPLRPTLGEE